jgi:hypothetical protein
MMHRVSQPSGRQYIDTYFVAYWEALPKAVQDKGLVNCEQHKCSDLAFHSLAALPPNTVPYVRNALQCVMNRQRFVDYCNGADSIDET